MACPNNIYARSKKKGPFHIIIVHPRFFCVYSLDVGYISKHKRNCEKWHEPRRIKRRTSRKNKNERRKKGKKEKLKEKGRRREKSLNRELNWEQQKKKENNDDDDLSLATFFSSSFSEKLNNEQKFTKRKNIYDMKFKGRGKERCCSSSEVRCGGWKNWNCIRNGKELTLMDLYKYYF